MKRDEFANCGKRLCGVLPAVITLALSACAHGNRPAPAPPAVTGSGQGAVGESAGVRMVARARTWNGDPPTLARYVLPIWIQVENHSGKALWLRYSALHMEDAADSQVTLPAVPPVSVKGKAIIPASAVPPEFRPEDLWLGDWLEPDVDDYLARVTWEEDLPTREMLRRAIREGVVADGGKVAGFVYFQKATRDLAALTLRADLIDATTKQSFGQIAIPLTVVNALLAQ